MNKTLDISRYNDAAQGFIKTHLNGVKILGVRHINRGRYEDEVFYEEFGKIIIASLPQKHVTSTPCILGDLDWLVETMYANVYGYRLSKICWWYDRRSCQRIENVVKRMLASAA